MHVVSGWFLSHPPGHNPAPALISLSGLSEIETTVWGINFAVNSNPGQTSEKKERLSVCHIFPELVYWISRKRKGEEDRPTKT
jgi:hypothetical protein